MLLNELQKLRADAEKQSQRAQEQDETIRQLQARLAALEALLSGKASILAAASTREINERVAPIQAAEQVKAQR
jgi:hypothetical protein